MEKRYLHILGKGHGEVKGPENMERNPVLNPKSKAHDKKKEMAKKIKKEIPEEVDYSKGRMNATNNQGRQFLH